MIGDEVEKAMAELAAEVRRAIIDQAEPKLTRAQRRAAASKKTGKHPRRLGPKSRRAAKAIKGRSR